MSAAELRRRSVIAAQRPLEEPRLEAALQAEAVAEPRNDVIDDDDFEIDEGTADELPTATADPSQDIPLTEVC